MTTQTAADILDQQLQYSSIEAEYLEGLRATHVAAKDDPEKMFQYALVSLFTCISSVQAYNSGSGITQLLPYSILSSSDPAVITRILIPLLFSQHHTLLTSAPVSIYTGFKPLINPRAPGSR